MRIYLLRHGETKDNVMKVLSGSRDAELSQNGIEQAKLLANRLRKVKYTRAYSSTLSRASLTLESVVGSQNFIQNDFLKERNFGEFEGKTHSEFYNAINNSLSKESFTPNGGESFVDVENRINLFWDKYLKETKGIIFIAAHGIFNCSFLKIFLGLTFEEQFNLKQGNTCVNIIEGSLIGKFEAIKINCTEHLT